MNKRQRPLPWGHSSQYLLQFRNIGVKLSALSCRHGSPLYLRRRISRYGVLGKHVPSGGCNRKRSRGFAGISALQRASKRISTDQGPKSGVAPSGGCDRKLYAVGLPVDG